MKTYKFTLLHKQYYDKEITAPDYETASQMFNDMVFNDELPWYDPDYIDSEQFCEEITE